MAPTWMASLGMIGASLGCAGKVVDVGGGTDEATPSSSTRPVADATDGGRIPGAPACTIPDAAVDAGTVLSADAGASFAPLLGTWRGYGEAFQLSSGSDVMSFAFSATPDGSLTGVVTFGAGSPPPPATNGDTAYPSPGTGGTVENPETFFPYSGFPYTATHLSFDGTRLTFGVSMGQLWKTWCPFQNSYDWPGAGRCSCAPNWSGHADGNGHCFVMNPDTGAEDAIDCVLVEQCEIIVNPAVCTCTISGCTAVLDAESATFDMQLSTGRLDGSMGGLAASPVTVHFVPSP
jgi:hypothetical protein